MKLLLTSNGISNDSIKKSLSQLNGKAFSDTNIAFIPTAADIEPGDKTWLIDDINRFKKLNPNRFDIVDIAILTKEQILKRIEKADILVFGGGNAYFLMHWFIQSGLKNELQKILENKIYVGISAGSMVTTTHFYPTYNHDIELYNEEIISKKDITTGLELVPFHVIPHLYSPNFPKVRTENIKQYASKTTDVIYAIDDMSAIQVVDGKVEIISEGVWEKFN